MDAMHPNIPIILFISIIPRVKMQYGQVYVCMYIHMYVEIYTVCRYVYMMNITCFQLFAL